MIWKLLFGLGWLGMFFISLTAVFFSVLPQYLQKIPLSPLVLRSTIIGIAIFYMALFVEKFSALFSNDESGYNVDTENGKIKISSITINTMVKQILSTIPYMKQLKIKNSIGKKGLNIKIEVEVSTVNNISAELKKVQSLIRENIKKSLEIEVANVDILTTKIASKRKENTKRGDLNAGEGFRETDNE